MRLPGLQKTIGSHAQGTERREALGGRDWRGVMIAKAAAGEIEEKPDDDGKDKAAVALGRKGGKARAEKMMSEQRSEIARKAARSRWHKD